MFWVASDFSTRSGIVFSEPKKLNGVEWRLKIYPRGNGLARDKYISVRYPKYHTQKRGLT